MAVLVAVAADSEVADDVAVVGLVSVDAGLDVLAAVVDVVDFDAVEGAGLTVRNSVLAAVIVDYLADVDFVCCAVV